MRLVALLAALALLGAACGDDDDNGAATGTGDNGGGGEQAITVTIGTDGIEAPEEIPAGAVEVSIEGEVSEFSEVNFTRVEGGMTQEAFTEALATITDGGAFPDEIVGNAGAVTGPDPIMVVLEPGEYFVWTEDPADDGGEEEGGEEGAEGEEGAAEDAPAEGEEAQEGGEEGGEEEGGPPSFFVTSATVTGEAEGELPDTEGSITASDYEFEVDLVAAEDGTFTFRNDGEQFHHAVVFNFGDIAPEDVEENLVEFMGSEGDTPPPEPFAQLDFEQFEAGGSGVFGPGGAGTFAATLESGNTYAVVCFIQDRSGGPPHVVAYDMFEVFTVE